MDQFITIGVEFIFWLQKCFSPHADSFFKTVTLLGEEAFFLLALPVIWFAIDKHLGKRLTLVCLLSTIVVVCLKEAFQLPRPFHLYPQLKIGHAGGYGWPSGHSQTAVVIWGMLAYHFKHRWFSLFAIVLVALIALSRLYLGVHFPADVVTGLGIGGSALLINYFCHDKLSAWLVSLDRTALYSFILGASIILSYIVKDLAMIALSGVLIGICFGILWPHSFPEGHEFEEQARWKNTTIALVGIVVIYFSGKLLTGLVSSEGLLHSLRLMRYILIGLWVSLGVDRLQSKNQKLAHMALK